MENDKPEQTAVNDSGTDVASDTPLTQPRSLDVRAPYPRIPSGWTYFVQRADRQIKIGFSAKPHYRIRSLTAEHGPLAVLAVVPSAVAGEFETHQKFHHLRTEGEWFVAGTDLLQFIEEVKLAPVPGVEPASHLAYDFSRPRVRLNPAKTISKMLKMRSAIGADTPAGHRISNIDEIRQNRTRAEAEGDVVRLAYLDASLARQLHDLETIRARHTH